MVAYEKPQQRKKEESKMLRGERDQIKFIDLRSSLIMVLVFYTLTWFTNNCFENCIINASFNNCFKPAHILCT